MNIRALRCPLVVPIALAALLSSCADAGEAEAATPQATSSGAPEDRTPAPFPAGVDSTPLLSADPDLAQRVSKLFVGFALDGSSTPPVDAPVRLYLGNAYATTISAAQSDDPLAYELCESYAGRSCPMSAVALVRALGPGGTRLGEAPSRCLVRQAPAPADTGASLVATLRPAGRVPCSEDFAVELSVNDAGQLTAVNLLLGSA